MRIVPLCSFSCGNHPSSPPCTIFYVGTYNFFLFDFGFPPLLTTSIIDVDFFRLLPHMEPINFNVKSEQTGRRISQKTKTIVDNLRINKTLLPSKYLSVTVTFLLNPSPQHASSVCFTTFAPSVVYLQAYNQLYLISLDQPLAPTYHEKTNFKTSITHFVEISTFLSPTSTVINTTF